MVLIKVLQRRRENSARETWRAPWRRHLLWALSNEEWGEELDEGSLL